MCGIGGIYQYTGGEPVNIRLMQDMLGTIVHRGPDDEGLYVDKELAIGMRRLSIIDLEGGKQPIRNEDGRIVVVCNGEIYNYRTLRAELEQRGHVFSTESDTEVIVHLYEEYGEDCVTHLRGMFAFAVWDRAVRRLFIARDRLGIKPLYYTQVGQGLVFGSEIKVLLQHPLVDANLDLDGLSHFLSLKYVPAPHTMFAGIRSLPPGHVLTCDRHGLRIRSYWDISFAQNGMDASAAAADAPAESEDTYAERLEELLRESIQLHLQSDVPFGAFLSGGLDSSLIVALMSQFLNQPVKTFSVGFQSDSSLKDELPYARLMAKHYWTDHHEVLVGPQDFINLTEKVSWHLDQPLADQATIPSYMLSSFAAQQVKMVLTGEGGDELFAGYARYPGERLSPLFRSLPGPAKSLALGLSNILPGLDRPKLALYALCQSDEGVRFANWFPLFNQDMKAQLLSGPVQKALGGTTTSAVFSHFLSQTDATQPLNRMLYVDTKLWLPDYLLARGDKLSMAASLEARVPLLDHKLVEFAAGLPPDLKLNGWTRKYLLKKVAKKWLPPQILDRKKQGFPIPIGSWFRNEMR